MYQYVIKEVLQVVAGDHLILDLDLGFRLRYRQEVTLLSVETPRYGSTGNQARLFTENFLKPENGPFTVQVDKDRKDNYEVQIFNSAGEDLADLLVEAKLGERVGS
jgi:endonuclease YncB( thermonuclease family)